MKVFHKNIVLGASPQGLRMEIAVHTHKMAHWHGKGKKYETSEREELALEVPGSRFIFLSHIEAVHLLAYN